MCFSHSNNCLQFDCRFKEREKGQEQDVLLLTVNQPSVSSVASETLPAALPKPAQLPPQQSRPMAAIPLPPIAIRQPTPVLPSPPTPAPPLPHQPPPPPIQAGLRAIAPHPDAPAPPPPPPQYSKTTLWRRKKEAEASRAVLGTPLQAKSVQVHTCSKCKQPKTKHFGHSQFTAHNGKKTHFCAQAEGMPVEEWLDKMRWMDKLNLPGE